VTQKRPVRCGLRQESKISCIWENIDLQRDWGWAEDYVVAMYLMLQQEQSDDYAIATGESYKLAEFIEIAFGVGGVGLAGVYGQ
jgi:GDPmannose 4,6-dehydratase